MVYAYNKDYFKYKAKTGIIEFCVIMQLKI